nr:hypothetical protein [uncultured Sphingomonas sp.]
MNSPRPARIRYGVSLAFAAISFIALAVFTQAIEEFAAQRGWNKFLVSGWAVITRLGLSDLVAFSFFALGGATLALWTEFWFRGRREAREATDRLALSSRANLVFSKSADGDLSVSLADDSENVGYFAWYVNNGGTMRNEAVLVFIEFEKEVPAPQVFAHSKSDGQWSEFATTDRFTFVQLKGWPEGEVVVQSVDSKALGLDRRFELQVWRPYSPLT